MGRKCPELERYQVKKIIVDLGQLEIMNVNEDLIFIMSQVFLY